ncbi:MAG: PEP-CTERM sorting domain-containing protein [Coleofasciculus sp.]|uniref:PEP-CTERM sorting domain-containing protein n=1 Tax=Coleofasciculus sp. TaxID=3100458 RepID=UPI003A494894
MNKDFQCFSLASVCIVLSMGVIKSQPAKAALLTQPERSALAQINTNIFTKTILFTKFGNDLNSTINFEGSFNSDGFNSTGSGSYLGKDVSFESSGIFTSTDTIEGQLSGIRLDNDTMFQLGFSYGWGDAGSGQWSFNGSVTDDFGTDDYSGSIGFDYDSDGNFDVSGMFDYDGDDTNLGVDIYYDFAEGTWEAEGEASTDIDDVRITVEGNVDSNGGSISGSIKEIPEPLTILGSATALGFGVLLKRESSKKKKS